MAYEWEIDEWWHAVHALTEMDRASTERVVGGIIMTGDPEDDQ